MELLTAIRDGGLRLDQVDDDTLERMRSRLGADAMGALIAREPRRSAAAPAVRAGLGRRWPLALAAAVAVGVTTWALIRPAGLPGGQPEGDAPIALTWPDRHAPFVPDARLAIGWRSDGLARDLPDFARQGPVTMGPGSEARRAMQLATVIVTFDDGFGSGAIISADGWILTNYHVVEGEVQKRALEGKPAVARIFLPRFKDGRIERVPEPVEATVYRCSPQHDLALLKLNSVPQALTPLPHFDIAQTVEPGDECFVVGSQSKGPAWMLRSGTVASIFQYPEGLSDEVIRQTSSVSAEVHRMRSEVICTDTSISRGDSGGPLLNAKGQLIGLTFATPSNLSVGSLGYHVGLRHVRAFTASLPSVPEASPPDLWHAAIPESVMQGPQPVDVDSNGRVDALRFGYSLPTGKGDEARPVGVALFIDLEERTSADEIDEARVLNGVPRGLWGMEDRGRFAWQVALVIREDGVVLTGYADASGLLSEVRQGTKQGQRTERAWVRDASGAWAAAPTLEGKPLLDSARVNRKHRATLAKIRDEVFGGSEPPKPDLPLKPGKRLPSEAPPANRPSGPGDGPNKAKQPG